jgi:hypothetical protein
MLKAIVTYFSSIFEADPNREFLLDRREIARFTAVQVSGTNWGSTVYANQVHDHSNNN